MFILTPIVINSSLTSKWAHVCIPIVIVAYLAISYDSSYFSFDCSDRVPNVRKKEKGLKSSFHRLCAMSISPSTNVILQIPMVKMCVNESRTTYHNFTIVQRLTSPGSQFYQNSFWFLRERKKLRCEEYFSQLRHYFNIPNGENAWH